MEQARVARQTLVMKIVPQLHCRGSSSSIFLPVQHDLRDPFSYWLQILEPKARFLWMAQPRSMLLASLTSWLVV